jgi:hypothetical protein
MLKGLKNSRGQSVSGEYVMVFFLALGAIAAMSVFFQRTLQGRIRDARNSMVGIVRAYNYQGNIGYEYEPYYTDTDSNIQRRSSVDSRLLSGGVSGISRDNISEETIVNSLSETAAPRSAY